VAGAPRRGVGPGGASTKDGERVELRANVGSLVEADLAREVGLTASGLVRTEFLFAGRESAPSVSEQVAAYDEILARLPGEVLVRALDAGSDKPLPYLPQRPSANPALGERGIRLLLRAPGLLADQVRALCRSAAPERVGLMLPMVSQPSELAAARRIATEVFADEGVELAVGAMIEVPIAALGIDALVPEADFLSVGTNDLLQYLFASDRAAADDVPWDEPPPAVWRLLAHVFEVAAAAGLPAGVCGELAGDPRWAGAVWGLGATTLSVAPARAAAVAEALATRSAAAWRSHAKALVDGEGDA
jgi:phosphoenolpyruvate-protein kinase (PTS system EI component)